MSLYVQRILKNNLQLLFLGFAFPIYLLLPLNIFAKNTDQPNYIRKIIINGNNKTRYETILTILEIDTGMIFDSASIKHWETKLTKTNLFRFVKIYSVVNEHRGVIIISLKEASYFKISDIGGELFNRKYGKSENWWKVRLGISLANFSGRNEHISLSTALWDSRVLGISWYKPFIKSYYFINIGFRLGSSPSVATPWYNTYLNQFTSFGKKIKDNSVLYANVTTRYNDYTYKGPKGNLTIKPLYDTLILINPITNIKTIKINQKKIPASLDLSNYMKYDTAWSEEIQTDSMTGAIFSWRGYPFEIIKEREVPYPEVHFTLGWTSDHRKKKFNPDKGIYYGISAITNIIPHKIHRRYLQFNQEIRVYHKGLFPNNTVAYRFRPTIRLGHGSVNEGLFMGGEPTLRGYASGFFGSDQVYNNRILFSSEYRFLLVTMPEMHLPWLSRYHNGLKHFHYTIDGALIFDSGYLWRSLNNPLNPEQNHTSAASTGFGLRLMAPTIQRSLCFDVVWGVYPSNYKKIWPPPWSLYIDMLF